MLVPKFFGIYGIPPFMFGECRCRTWFIFSYSFSLLYCIVNPSFIQMQIHLWRKCCLHCYYIEETSEQEYKTCCLHHHILHSWSKCKYIFVVFSYSFMASLRSLLLHRKQIRARVQNTLPTSPHPSFLVQNFASIPLAMAQWWFWSERFLASAGNGPSTTVVIYELQKCRSSICWQILRRQT